MSAVVDPIMQPDKDAIKAHLELLFAPLRDEYPNGLIELRYGKGFASAYFNLREEGVCDAVEFAASRASATDNVYVGVNPRKPGTNTKRGASDTDVECAIWQFADFDEEESVRGLGKRLSALPPYATVTTGTVPHRRPHLYWLLEEPVFNLPEWTQRQRGLVASLGSDRVVINPSRIMRLAGTVNFPPSHKVQKGYRVELVTLRTEFDDEREEVTPDEVARAYPAPTEAEPGASGIAAGETTLSAMARGPGVDVRSCMEAARSDQHWHENVRALTAHWTSKGWSNAEILAVADHLTVAGYSVEQTRREMARLVSSARQKWSLPEPQADAIKTDDQIEEDLVFEMLDLEEIESMSPPTYLVEDLIVDDGLTVIYGDPAAGKSFLAIDLGLRVSHAMDWHGTQARSTGVLYIAGEGKRGLGKRVKGWRRKHGMEGVEAPFILLPTAVELTDDKQREKLFRSIDRAVERAGFKIGLIIVDTVSRALAGGDENGSDAMGQFVAACDAIKRYAGGALIGVHHAGKDKDRGMRGSSVLLGACDGVLKVTKSESLVTVENEKQKDAEQAATIYMEMRKETWVNEALGKEQTTLVPFKKSNEQISLEQAEEEISVPMIHRAFGKMTDAWEAGNPLSHKVQTRKDGRFAPLIFKHEIGGSVEDWEDYLTSWLETECLIYDQSNSTTKRRGLRVLQAPGVMEEQ